MKVSELNHRLLANNIANADTPHYRPKTLDFQETLRAEVEGRGRVVLRKTQGQHFDVSRNHPEFESIAFLSKNDYNEVDLDVQMSKLQENTGRYTVYSSLLTKRFRSVTHMLDTVR
jgi:flagellar basal-body rod protein FlgB